MPGKVFERVRIFESDEWGGKIESGFSGRSKFREFTNA
jgi:hypothetical protein